MDFDDEDGWGRPGFIPWALGLTIMFVASTVAYFMLPDGARIPQQINPGGAPINFDTKGWVLFSPPCVFAALALVVDVIPFSPRPKREISLTGKYLSIAIGVFVTFCLIGSAFKWHRP